MSADTETRGTPSLGATVALYTFARIGLLALVAGVLALVGVPVLLAILIGLVVALPLSMVLFRGLRARLDSALAVARERRGAERAVLRAGLRGDDGGVAAPEPEPGPTPASDSHSDSATSDGPADRS